MAFHYGNLTPLPKTFSKPALHQAQRKANETQEEANARAERAAKARRKLAQMTADRLEHY